MGFNLKEFLNMNNKDKPKASPVPATTAQPERSTFSKVFDQVNTFDNGRSYQNATPTTTKSIWQQAGDNLAGAARQANMLDNNRTWICKTYILNNELIVV